MSIRERGGQWTVVSGQWLVVSGQWSVVSGFCADEGKFLWQFFMAVLPQSFFCQNRSGRFGMVCVNGWRGLGDEAARRFCVGEREASLEPPLFQNRARRLPKGKLNGAIAEEALIFQKTDASERTAGAK